MNDKLNSTIRTLCTLPGPSGLEDPVREYLLRRVTPYADEVKIDPSGNLLVFKKGRKDCGKTVLLAAHMDEVGLLVRSITDLGFVKFDFAGGVDRRVVLGKKVYLGPGSVPGVIAMKPIHLTTEKERESMPKTEDLYIDIGAQTKEEAQELVRSGDWGVFSAGVKELSGGYLQAKALDDRVGCGILAELLEQDLPIDLWATFTVGEESGCRGAFGAAFALKPDIALVLEGTTAADAPSQKGAKKVCSPGKGPVLPFMDGASIYDRELFELLRDLADRNKIPWQTKTYLSGGTDASAFQRTGSGAKVAAISAAVRYIHAPATVGAMEDFDRMLRLCSLFLEELAQ